MQLTMVGVLVTSGTVTDTLRDPNMLFVVFSVGYISIFVAYIFLQLANQHINHSALVFFSLALAIIGGLAMLNYEDRIVEIHRYLIG